MTTQDEEPKQRCQKCDGLFVLSDLISDFGYARLCDPCYYDLKMNGDDDYEEDSGVYCDRCDESNDPDECRYDVFGFDAICQECFDELEQEKLSETICNRCNKYIDEVGGQSNVELGGYQFSALCNECLAIEKARLEADEIASGIAYTIVSWDDGGD